MFGEGFQVVAVKFLPAGGYISIINPTNIWGRARIQNGLNIKDQKALVLHGVAPRASYTECSLFRHN
jgi:hypothetical protein